MLQYASIFVVERGEPLRRLRIRNRGGKLRAEARKPAVRKSYEPRTKE